MRVKCLAQEHSRVSLARARFRLPCHHQVTLNQYLIFGFGFPVAPHVNVTFSPSSAVVSAGGTVIIGGDDFSDSKVVGFSLSGTTTATVTGAKNSKQLPD